MLSQISGAFSKENVNIEKLSNNSRGEYAYTVVETADDVKDSIVSELKAVADVIRVWVIK